MIIADPGREQRVGGAARPHRLRSRRRLSEGRPAAASESRADLTATTERLSAPVAAERLATARPLLRSTCARRGEREQKRVAGSMSIPLNHLAERSAELPRDRPLLVYCAGGYRSSIAASLLQRLGFTEVSEIAGGLAAWEAAKLPVKAA